MKTRYLTAAEARRVARQFKVKVPRVGYEMSLGGGRRLNSTGHFQFGWIGSAAPQPFSLTCRCDETLRPNEPRGCEATCPNKDKP